MAFKTQFTFRLPRGFVDDSGNLHREGVMRLATARDEILPLQDYRVQANRAYLVIVLLSRVVTKLGDVPDVTPDVVENLFAADFDHLQRLYERLNTDGESVGSVTCPSCSQPFEVDLTDIEDRRLGE